MFAIELSSGFRQPGRHRRPLVRSGPASPPPPVRVLVVDDSLRFRGVVRELLERRGYVLAGEAGSAASAMRTAAVWAPDAALLDVHLPDGNGFELAARVTRAWPGVAVLLMSASYETGFHARAHASGARGFVPKSHLARVDLARFWPTPTPPDPDTPRG